MLFMFAQVQTDNFVSLFNHSRVATVLIHNLTNSAMNIMVKHY